MAILWLPLVIVIMVVTLTPVTQYLVGISEIVAPNCIAAWWLFGNLKSTFTVREARTVAIVFAVFAPISEVITIPFATIPGGYAANAGRPFGLIGATATVIVMTAIISYTFCSAALWLTRRTGKSHPMQ
jgi:hypothetical protein